MFNGPIYVKSQPKHYNNDGNDAGSKMESALRPPRRLPPEVLTDDEVAGLMRACSHRAPTGIRNRALIALLYRAGLRITEALSLYPKDLELNYGIIRVLNGKGGKSRTVGIDPGAAAIIQRWLDMRSRIDLDQSGKFQRSVARPQINPDLTKKPKRNLSGRHPFFCTLAGQPMSASYGRVMLKRLTFKAGIDKRVHAHGFRHTHAAQLRAEGVDIAIISRQLGHSRIHVTARYLDLIAPTAVIWTLSRRKWTEIQYTENALFCCCFDRGNTPRLYRAHAFWRRTFRGMNAATPWCFEAEKEL